MRANLRPPRRTWLGKRGGRSRRAWGRCRGLWARDGCRMNGERISCDICCRQPTRLPYTVPPSPPRPLALKPVTSSEEAPVGGSNGCRPERQTLNDRDLAAQARAESMSTFLAQPVARTSAAAMARLRGAGCIDVAAKERR